jgi:ABC-type glycerol-3-phosphate transport system permease component
MRRYDSDYAMLLAFITLTLVPIIIFNIIAERQIFSIFTTGAVSG